MGLISHKFSDLINLDVKEGRRQSVKRGNYRDFVVAIPVEYAPEGWCSQSGLFLLYPLTIRKFKRSQMKRDAPFFYGLSN
ncbi:Hypothetical protein AKI40_1721 [Enterobacter sp. FY-07]|nr:Hypothetical protein AKI40_1721 [Enterobacter sp. FY-07]